MVVLRRFADAGALQQLKVLTQHTNDDIAMHALRAIGQLIRSGIVAVDVTVFITYRRRKCTTYDGFGIIGNYCDHT